MRKPSNMMKIIAYLHDIDGVKLIIECIGPKNETRYAFLLPPDYDLGGWCPFVIVQAAIAKHAYVSEVENIVVWNKAELLQYVSLRNTESVGAHR